MKAGNCAKHGQYHSDHGCGYAIKVGSSFADHIIRRHYTKEKGDFMKWEAPTGKCPDCWHNTKHYYESEKT